MDGALKVPDFGKKTKNGESTVKRVGVSATFLHVVLILAMWFTLEKPGTHNYQICFVENCSQMTDL